MKRVVLALGLIGIINCCAMRTFAADGWASVSDTSGTAYNLTGGAAGATVTPTTAAQFYTYATSSTPYVIQVSGTINVSAYSNHRINVKSNKTIVGIGTSPTIYGGLNISGVSNIIISRLNINFDANEGSEDPSTDGITIQSGAHHIWINHCSIYNSPDGLIDIGGASDYVTISWCKFYYETGIYNTAHHFTNLIGSDDGDTGDRGKLHITFHHNWWSSLCVERMPRVRFGQVHIYNNYYSCSSNDYCIRPGVEAQLLVENNYFYIVDEPIDDKDTDAMVESSGNYTYHCTNVHSDVGTDDVFTPPYSYGLISAVYVRTIVMAGAGADGTEPTPPAVPTGLTAEANETFVVLDWNDNTESNLKGYNVYRFTDADSNYTRLTIYPITTSTYTDSSVAYGTTYYYAVTSLNTYYSESDYSSEVTAIPRIYGDFEINHTVDMNDVGYLNDLWLIDDCDETVDVDINGDCLVNFLEFEAMAENWMTQ